MHRVLIADDAPFMRQTLREIIEPLGYEVVAEASCGLEAVELFALHQPDLAVVDMVMPRASGIDTVRMVLNRFPAARLVMASALGQEGLALDALAEGARDFISKPFQPDTVEDILTAVVEKPEEEVSAAGV